LVDSDDLERLRTDAASRDYPAMARLARALYENGLTTEQVLHECYGVEFPRELIVIADANPYALDLLATWTNQPWQLAIPLNRGGPASRADTIEPMERRLHDLDPDLLPLLFLVRPGIDVDDDELVLCYRLTELTAGRPTIFGVRQAATRLDEVARRGDSLLAALHDHHAKYLHELEGELEKWYRKEADFVDEDEVEEVRALLDQVEAFQRAAEG
jgi:hypothetical protein